jgi:hypothetical protein
MTDRHGSKTSKIRISLRRADGGRSSFMLAIRDAVIVSTSGRPSAGQGGCAARLGLRISLTRLA